jgi:hypothetical protein
MRNVIIIQSIIVFLSLLALVLLFIKKKALKWKYTVTPFIWMFAVAALYEFVFSFLLNITATYWYQFYYLLYFSFVFILFKRLLERKHQTLFTFFALLFGIVYGISFLFFDKYSVFTISAINEPVTMLFVLTFSILWFLKTFDEMKIPNLWKDGNFYLVSGLMLYQSGTFFFFLLSGALSESNLYFYDYWMVNIIAVIAFKLILVVAVWKME